MAKKIKSLEEIQISSLTAIKRALLRRGYVPGKSTDSRKASEEGPTPQELVHTTVKSHDVLFRADTVFPFTPFPHTIILDREQLTIIQRVFFKVAKTTSIRVEDILSAEVAVGPFFGSLSVVSRYYSYQFAGGETSEKAPSIKYLWKHDAQKVHKLIQGYIIARLKEIDCSKVPKDKLIEMLYELGKHEAGD
jgi:hypothetical protein